MSNPASAGEYQPFPDVARRNFMQEGLEVPAMVQLLGLPRGGRVLEVGCGRGVALPPLADALRPDLLAGLDIDGSLLAEAACRAAEKRIAAQLYRADVRALPFPSESFDVVIDFGTCYHIAHPKRAMREVVRVLRTGGLFVAETLSSQLLSHPFRSRRKPLPWETLPELELYSQGVLWKARRKLGAIMRSFALILTFLGTALTVADAQWPPDVSAGARIQVRLPEVQYQVGGTRGHLVRGRVSALAADTLYLAVTDSIGPLPIPRHLIQQLQFSRGVPSRFASAARRGVIAGAGLALLAVILNESEQAPHETSTGNAALIGGGVGLLTGGVLGALYPLERWKKVRLEGPPSP
jgi:SAM-dependent methyltransferase